MFKLFLLRKKKHISKVWNLVSYLADLNNLTLFTAIQGGQGYISVKPAQVEWGLNSGRMHAWWGSKALYQSATSPSLLGRVPIANCEIQTQIEVQLHWASLFMHHQAEYGRRVVADFCTRAKVKVAVTGIIDYICSHRNCPANSRH